MFTYHAYEYVYIHIHMCKHTCVCAHTHMGLSISRCAGNADIYTYMYICIYLCIHVCMYVYIYTYIYIQICMYIYIPPSAGNMEALLQVQVAQAAAAERKLVRALAVMTVKVEKLPLPRPLLSGRVSQESTLQSIPIFNLVAS